MTKTTKCKALFCIFFFISIFSLTAEGEKEIAKTLTPVVEKREAGKEVIKNPQGKKDLKKIVDSYPEIDGKVSFDKEVGDWRLDYTNRRGEADTLFYANGALLPLKDLPNQSNFTSKFYEYPKKLYPPEEFTPEIVEKIKAETTLKKRQNGKKNSPYFYDSIFGTHTRRSTEANLKRIKFLNKRVTIHKDLIPKLEKVETEIQELATNSEEVQRFLKQLLQIDGYNWRMIADSPNLSIHGFGLALDLLPRVWNRSNIYWLWSRQAGYEDWMLIPLEKRWMPPQSVIRAFEKEGFIWGGKWVIWDNMHFEYAPYLINF